MEQNPAAATQTATCVYHREFTTEIGMATKGKAEATLWCTGANAPGAFLKVPFKLTVPVWHEV